MKRAATAIAADAARPTVPRVAYLVYRVERRLRTRIDAAVSTVGVTTPEYVTLSVLRERDGLSNAQLARWAFVTPQAMNLVISALERRGLVRRRPDPRHRRVLRTSVTPTGPRAPRPLRSRDGRDRGRHVARSRRRHARDRPLGAVLLRPVARGDDSTAGAALDRPRPAFALEADRSALTGRVH